MSVELLTLLFFGSLLFFLFIGTPLVFTLGGISVIFLYFTMGPVGFYIVASKFWDSMMSFTLIAIPMYVYMAMLLEKSGVANDLYRMMHLWFGALSRRTCDRHRRDLRDLRRDERHQRRRGRDHGHDRAAADARARLRQAARGRRDQLRRRLGHPDSAVDPDGALRPADRGIGRPAVRLRHRSRHPAVRAGLDLYRRPRLAAAFARARAADRGTRRLEQ